MQHQATLLARQFQAELGRQPSDQEIAEVLQISITEWQEIKLAFRNRSPLSLDAPMHEDEEVAKIW